jgi:hypothetical protein
MTSIALVNPQQAHAAITSIYTHTVKPGTMAGHRYRLTVREETRTEGQNRFFHKLAGEIAKAGVEWQGKKRTAIQWKVLLVSGHAVATQEGAEIIPGLEGEFVNIRESTALMSIKRGASLIEYTLAFCAMHGVPIPAMEGQE